MDSQRHALNYRYKTNMVNIIHAQVRVYTKYEYILLYNTYVYTTTKTKSLTNV